MHSLQQAAEERVSQDSVRMTSQAEQRTVSHAEREAAAYANWMAAVRRQDHGEIHRLWFELRDLINSRPACVVRAMEDAKGLR
jgi:hypothetical protein